MSEAEQDKIIDEWVVERNKHIGEIMVVQIGEYPPNLDNLYGAIQNELITAGLIRQYANATGDRNPMWHSEEYTKGTIWGGMIAPPLILDSIAQPFPFKYQPEYLNKFESFQSLPAGRKCEWFQVIRPGDKFRVLDKFLGLVEKKPKESQPYRFFISTTQRTFINQREEKIAVEELPRGLVINLPRGGEKLILRHGSRKKHKYTNEELDAIYRGYAEETRRGADTLYWEDVVVGEELKPLVAGPISTWDVASFLVVICGHVVAYDMEWERLKLNIPHEWLDPEVNVWKCGGEAHLCEQAAQIITGGNHSFAFSFQIDGLICRMIYNWMGDSGFLKMFESRFDTVAIHGDTLYVKGKVTNKSIEGGEHLVDLEVRCENQDGLLLVPGRSRVRLLSRTGLQA